MTINTGEKLKKIADNKKVKKILSLLANFTLFALLAVYSSAAEININMLDVGQGLSVLFESDGEYMLYDGGGRDASSYVVSYLKQNDVTSLDYLVASHYDEDHIAGLIGVLNTASVDNVLNPDYETDTKIYSSYISKRDSSGAAVTYPTTGYKFDLGSAEVEVLSPDSFTFEDENNNSIALKVTCGDFSCIITGDAEEEAEYQMIYSGADLDCDLYIVGHHGSSSSSSDAFVSAMTPNYSFISVGADNSYGHPTEETLNTLAAYNSTVYRTDLNGEITLSYSDGEVSISTEKNLVEAVPEESSEIQEEDSQSTENTYILNTNTKKFHYPSCSSVGKMSEKNKQEYSGSRDDLIAQGYSPCGNCNP